LVLFHEESFFVVFFGRQKVEDRGRRTEDRGNKAKGSISELVNQVISCYVAYFAEWHRKPGSSGASHNAWISGKQEIRKIENRGQKPALSDLW